MTALLMLGALSTGIRAESLPLLPSHEPQLASLAILAETASAEPLVSIRVLPEEATLVGSRSVQRFLVLGRYGDGRERDVTAQVSFHLSDPNVVRLENGQAFGLQDGETSMTFRLQSLEATAQLRVQGSDQVEPFSFVRDVGGVLTRRGCNTSTCHGSVKGQAGFKLSVSATNPKADYRWIVKGGVFQVLTSESKGPEVSRVDLEEPEQSLILLKATGAVPHGGGKRLATGSPGHEVLLEWIRKGAAYGEEGAGEGVVVEKLEVLPGDLVLDAEASHQLLVLAHLSDGSQQDFTDQVRYTSNDVDTVRVDFSGKVEAVNPGETAIVIQGAGQAVSSRVGVVSRAVADYPDVPTFNLIDTYVFDKLRRFNLVPSKLSSDAEFLRRVCLDLTGTLPPPHRVREFLESKNPNKREHLIEALLDSPEWADFWAFRFGDLLRWYGGATQLENDTQYYGQWVRNSLAENKPYDQIARARIAAQGYDAASRHYYVLRFLTPPPDVITEQVRLFLGRRLDCARCHDHPFEAWTQDQFWGLAAFYGRMIDVRRTVMDDSLLVDYPEMASRVVHPRSEEVVEPTYLDGRVVPEGERSDLRMRLADWVIDHPYFAETAVNRMWDWFFGRGFVNPVDDFRSTNPPTHPKLLKALAQDFRDSGYDLKHLMRRIARSRTYQLSGEPKPTNRNDAVNFSRSLPRALDTPVLLDMISQVTGVPEEFAAGNRGYPPGTRAIQVLPGGATPFFEAYGRNDRKQLPDEKPQPTLSQALHMLTGPAFTEKIGMEGGRVDQLLTNHVSDEELIEELYLTALSRFPTSSEQEELTGMIRSQPSRRTAVEALIWALITSREFAYNH